MILATGAMVSSIASSVPSRRLQPLSPPPLCLYKGPSSPYERLCETSVFAKGADEPRRESVTCVGVGGCSGWSGVEGGRA
jgi:hypothetical protein